MDLTISPRKLRGEITVIPSKSQAHRMLICAALADGPTHILCPQTNRDMDATAACLNALGAVIRRTDSGYHVQPIDHIPNFAVLNCCESGSTLRFLLPLAGALGVDTIFQLEGRLPQRPLSPLWEEMERMGCRLCRPTADTIRCQGRLRPGNYTIDGGVSSQFITGLLFALSLLPGSTLEITGTIESKPYIDMTKAAMDCFGGSAHHSPGQLLVEGDWSNGAFWMTAKALGSDLIVSGLDEDSLQGDRAVATLLPELEAGTPTISARDIPDLIPVLSIAAAHFHGAVFQDIQRLRLKESDRVSAVVNMICALGGKAESTEDALIISGTGLIGGTVDAVNDHRIAMAAAVGSTVCQETVTIFGAQCVEKSYPRFWEEFFRLGGNYEQHLR